MKKSILFLAAFAALVSCTKENPVDENPVLDTPVIENQSITFEATAPSTTSDDATKTTLVGGGPVHWVKGDAVKVMFVPINGTYEIKNNQWPGQAYDGASGVMTATFDSETAESAFFTGSWSWGVGKEFMNAGIAVYPSTVHLYSHRQSDAFNSNLPTEISYDLPSVQTAIENSFQNGVAFSYAEIADKDVFDRGEARLQFKNACALIKVTLPATAYDIVSVKVESSNGKLAGKYKVDTNNGFDIVNINYQTYNIKYPLYLVEDAGQGNVTLTASQGETLEAGATYYIVTWPGSHNDLTFTFTNSLGLTASKSVSAVTLEAAKYDYFYFRNPIVFEHKFEVSNDSFSVDCGENSGQFTVLSSRDWTAASSESWLMVSTKSGSASANPTTVEFTAAANNSAAERTATITIKAGEDTKTVTVTQAAFVPEMTLSQTSLSFEDVATTGSFTVTSNVYWDASSDQTWLTLSPNSGSPSSFASGVTVNVAANTSNDERTATITVTGNGITRTIAVTQAGAPKTSGFKVVGPVLPEELETGKYYVIANYGDPTKYWTVADDGFYSLSLTGGFSTNEYSNEFGPEHIFTVEDVSIGDSNTAQVTLFSMLSNKGLAWVSSLKTYRCNNQWGVILNMGADTDNSVDIIDPNNRDSNAETIDYINTADGSTITCVQGWNGTGNRKWLIYEVQ